jgi:hypothetical protein
MKMKLLMTSVRTSLFLVACGGGSSDDGPATTNPSELQPIIFKIQLLKLKPIQVLT